MSEYTNQVLYRFYYNLGRELERVRLAKNLTIEEAAKNSGFNRSKNLRRMESGKFCPVFHYMRMIQLYQQKLVIRLEDEL